MKVYDIKNKVSAILQTCQDSLTKVFLVVGVISVAAEGIGNLLGGAAGSIISLGITLAFMPFYHGYIVSTLKATNNRGQEIDVEEDAFVGFRRFKDLFFTYFVQTLFLGMIIFAILIIGFAIIILILPSGVMSGVFDIYTQAGLGVDVSAMYLTDAMLTGAVSASGFILLLVCIILFVIVMYGLYFALVPYVLERYGIKGISALKESARMMKGYKGLLFRIQFSFLGYIILQFFITSMLSLMLPVPYIVSIIGAIISVYLYQVRLTTCQTVLFEEIDYADKHENQSVGE